MTSKIRELAFQGASTQEIRKAAIKGGMSTLYDDGIRKVLEGTTTIEEVFRVAKKSEPKPPVVGRPGSVLGPGQIIWRDGWQPVQPSAATSASSSARAALRRPAARRHSATARSTPALRRLRSTAAKS